jgi:AbrB family looped-hinge helix DNA binding protein
VDIGDGLCLACSVQTTLTKHGTVELPKPLLDGLDLHAGDRLQVTAAEGGRIVLAKRRRTRSWLKVLRACPESLPSFAREHFAERACSL